MTDPIDSTAEELDAESVTSTELVPTPQATLFATDDPVEVVERATRVANALKGVLVEQKMIQRIGQGEHVKVEGWQTLGGMLGVVPVVVWTRRVTEPDGWEAKVEARTLDGRVVGAGEAQCDRGENRWKTADEHAIRSMAQTRATSKALAAPLRFVVKLAGFSGTPAEEVPAEPSGYGQAQQERPVSPSQVRLVYELASGKLTGRQLLNLLREVKGDPPVEVEEQAALGQISEIVNSLTAEQGDEAVKRIRKATA